MKVKPVNSQLIGTRLGRVLQSRIGVVLSNWVFQGMRQMNAYEIGLKIAIDVVVGLMLTYFLVKATVPPFVATPIGALVAHTINWIANGHIFVLLRYVRPVRKAPSEFERYVSALSVRSAQWSAADGVAIFGSYCRDELHEYSDLDVRIIVSAGILPGCTGALYCLLERIMALGLAFPLDIYCCVGNRGLEKLRDDERPVILLDRSGALRRLYVDGPREPE